MAMIEKEMSAGQGSALGFYFRYQLSLELIPYVELEVRDFIQFCEHELQADQGKAASIRKVMLKKIKQLDCFYQRNYPDYRAHFILKARKALTAFWQSHASILKEPLYSELPQEEADFDKHSKIESEQKIEEPPSMPLRSPVLSSPEIKHEPFSPKRELEKHRQKSKLKKTLPSHLRTEPASRPNKSKEIKKHLHGSKQKSPKKHKQPEKKLSKEQYIAHLKNRKRK